MPFKKSSGRLAQSGAPNTPTDCDMCNHLNLAFEAMLEYHAIARARYEAALLRGDTAEAFALEMELTDSAEPIRRAAKELREHEAHHSRASVKTCGRLLRLVKPRRTKDGASFLLDGIEDV
jgi:hypothetical protein